MEHFIIHCTALELIRESFKYLLEKLASDLEPHNKGLVSAILDPSYFEETLNMNKEGKLRGLCHRLHWAIEAVATHWLRLQYSYIVLTTTTRPGVNKDTEQAKCMKADCGGDAQLNKTSSTLPAE